MKWLTHERANTIGVIVSIALSIASFSLALMQWLGTRESAIVTASRKDDGYDVVIKKLASDYWLMTVQFSVSVSNTSSSDTAVKAIRFDFSGDGLILNGISSNPGGRDVRTGKVLDEAPVFLPAGSTVAFDVIADVDLIGASCHFAELDPKAAELKLPIGKTEAIFLAHKRSFPGCSPLHDIRVSGISLEKTDKQTVTFNRDNVPEDSFRAQIYAVLTRGFVAQATIGSVDDYTSGPYLTVDSPSATTSAADGSARP